MARYKWDSPREWLMEQAANWDASKLFAELSAIVEKLDADTIQDLYQTEMSEDGYFRDLDKTVPFLAVTTSDGSKEIVYFCNSTCLNLYVTTETALDGLSYTEGKSNLFDNDATCEHCGKTVLHE